MPSLTTDSPHGPLHLQERDGALVSINWEIAPQEEPTALLQEAARQLAAYFDGRLTRFNLPLAPGGSDFQQSVNRLMQEIPYGMTRSYGDLAKQLGVPAQPIGQACGANTIPIIIPCHRVLAADGKLGGFSAKGGVETKIALLRLEGAAGLLL